MIDESSTKHFLRIHTANNFRKSEFWQLLDSRQKENFDIVTSVLPFRVNDYVLRSLIDWNDIPRDPMFQLVFPQPGMLSEEDYRRIQWAFAQNDGALLKVTIDSVRQRMNPHPAQQMTLNIPSHRGKKIQGVQHKYPETLLVFPAPGQTCHSYCSFCFRWPQFVGDPDLRLQAKDPTQFIDYIIDHPEITDVLLTGGDPMVMSARSLERFILPIIEETNISNIRIGSKSITYWPFRFINDDDASEVLGLFRRVVDSGIHLAFMAHFNHPRELEPVEVRKAIQLIQSTGAVIRTQAPILRHVNDDSALWIKLWNESVRLGCVPYYMFIERDTGPSEYFKIPLSKALDIFQSAYRRTSGLARTVRGPIMSTMAGKVQLDGVISVGARKMFQLQFLQARDPSVVRHPFLADYDEEACWFDELRFIEPSLNNFVHRQLM